jgi:hypothetical protein
MTKETDITIYTQDDSRVKIDWDDGVWFKISVNRASVYTVLTRDEAQQLLAGLQAILSKEVTA